MLTAGDKLLRSRYQLISGPIVSDASAASWLGMSEDESTYLVKTWPYAAELPSNLERALWDAELRTLYRVGSSPGAQDSLLVLRDAGVDKEAKCFAMVLEAPGYASLASALTQRSKTPWLAGSDIGSRQLVWKGLQQLATGIRLLHDQNVLHRDVRAETVFYNVEMGPSSLRLGGFEWSVRLGAPGTQAPELSWSSPPEFFIPGVHGYRPETDWYAFGTLAVRLLLSVESYAKNEPIERHDRMLKEVERSGPRLSDIERALLNRLIARNPRERIVRGYEISVAIQDIAQALERSRDPRADERPLVVVINPGSANRDLIDSAVANGFVPDTEKPQDAFNPNNVLHSANLTQFVQQDLSNAQIYAVANAPFYIAIGERLILNLLPFESFDNDRKMMVKTWQYAACQGIGELRRNDGGTGCVRLPQGAIVVRTRRQVTAEQAVRQNSRDWTTFLPRVDKTDQLRANLARFQEFIRCTNQLELLIRDSELFRYRVVDRRTEDGEERLALVEADRERPPLKFCEIDGGLAEFVTREFESNKAESRFVVLTGKGQDALTLQSVSKADRWEIRSIDADRATLHLARVASGKPLAQAPDEGTLRTWGMFGQVALIRRRKRAIDRIEKHSYLLRSLSSPGQVYMDTGSMQLPVPLSPALVDQAKQAAIEDILRVRPIYALQGPPGTGKTTLVAHLLRQVFEDDPVAQVLITAQAHGAVDVLRSKVRDEAFKGVAEDAQPLAVRLGIAADGNGPGEGSVEHVSLQILQRAKLKLKNTASRSKLQEEWLEAVGEMETSLTTWTPDATAPDFCEVVKRGANITYCTTSAGDLEVLADATQSFDWAIVEEAGKAHGFDLALPLQAGHRWLLIGDQKQLPPYRFKDYRDGIDALDQVVDALESLTDRGGNLVDFDWIRSWRGRSPEEKSEFKNYAREWLNTFAKVFDYCTVAVGAPKRTVDHADGAAAGMLSQQHRMHPTIGELISAAYYKDELVSKTEDSDGNPIPRVLHPFVRPQGIETKAIVWIDVPWSRTDRRYEEVGGSSGRPRFTNPREVEALDAFFASLQARDRAPDDPPLTLAVLSPYNQQVALINRRISESAVTRAGLTLKTALGSRPREGAIEAPPRIAHTVDSFQGNQASVIAVSLVRNNSRAIGEGFGFLEEAPRINVLLSRAERLLVLVGSWDFFEHQLRATSLDDPQLPLWHWKKVMDSLSIWFKSGRALKLSLDELHVEEKQ